MKSDPLGLVGLGLMGRGIAASFLGAGFPVIAVDTRPQAVREARAAIESAMQEMLDHGAIVPEVAASWQERYKDSGSIADCKACGFIVESVLEDIEVKREVYDQLENLLDPAVPIASNTSALPITALQEGRRNPSRFLGMHWASPAYATRFLEIICGDQTSEAVLEAASRLGAATGKDPCIVRQDLPGFIVNRLGYAMYREAASLLEAGVGDVETIDRAFRNGFGLWSTFCGPFRWIDITGGPELYAKAMTGVIPTLNRDQELPAQFARRQRDGEKGVVNGRGFYRYEQGDAERWRKLFHEHAWEVKRIQDRLAPLPSDEEKK